MVRLLGVVWGAFVVWMVIDAVRRDADSKWFWNITLVPGGALVYFVSVKLRDPGTRMLGRRLLEQLKRPPSVEELERRFARTPSVENRVLLGQALFDAGRFADAQARFEEVLEARADDKDALYGLAVCRLEQGDPASAVAPLTKLVELHRGYRDYAAWADLAEAHFKSGEREMCHELLADLVKTAPRLPHHVLRAQYLLEDGRQREAEELLRAALDAERDQPRHVRRQNRAWMRRANRMLEERAGAG
jgi:hypothetical protein